MSYEKTTWQNGDTITAEKLNNIEGGVQEASTSCSNSFMVRVVCNNDSGMMETNKTWQEILNAFSEGKSVSFILYKNDNVGQYLFRRMFHMDDGTYRLILAYPMGSNTSGSTAEWSVFQGNAPTADSIVAWEE